uniref:Glutathione S-transferase omega n=1 Tax=Leptobrachium leishanense TaxID=445787 RepID=A0A8C5Q1R4_9ANUR
MTGSERSLRKGSSKPGPVPEGYVRLYDMRFCPYAHRPRLILLAKGIKHEIVNINLINKPEWYLEKNPSGLVPALELSTGDVITESLIVSEYLDEAYPGPKLTPSDPLQKAKQKIILEYIGQVTSLLVRLLKAKKSNQDLTELKAEANVKLQKLNEILVNNKTPYFGGEDVSMSDYMIYPWFERAVLFDVTDRVGSTLKRCAATVSEYYGKVASKKDACLKKKKRHIDSLIVYFISWTRRVANLLY